MRGSVKYMSGEALVMLAQQCLQNAPPDIESATEAYDEAVRRDRKRLVEKLSTIFEANGRRPIPWLAKARNNLSVLELPPKGIYQGHLYVVLISGFTEQNQFYGAYVGSSRYKPETRFQKHKSGQHSSGIVQLRGIQVLKSLCWPDEHTVPGGHSLIDWESALNRCLALVIPKVSGDFKPIKEWEECFQKPLRNMYGL